MAKTKGLRIDNSDKMTIMTCKGKLHVEKFRYLGSVLTEDWRCEEEIKVRLS